MSTIIFYDAGENARAKMNYWREKGLKDETETVLLCTI